MDEHGMGYSEDRFVGKSPGDFLCSICLGVYRDVRVTIICGHHFCKKCIEDWTKHKNNRFCPYCRADFPITAIELVKNDDKFQDNLNNLQLKCLHADKGCPVVEKLEDIDAHDQNCLFIHLSPNVDIKKILKDGSKIVKSQKRKIEKALKDDEPVVSKILKLQRDLICKDRIEDAEFFEKLLRNENQLDFTVVHQEFDFHHLEGIDQTSALTLCTENIIAITQCAENCEKSTVKCRLQQCFFDCIEHNERDKLMKLLGTGLVNVNCCNKSWESGATALIRLAQFDDVDMMRFLLLKNAKIDAKDLKGRTALMVAALEGNVSSCNTLISLGADLNATDCNGKGIFYYACNETKRFKLLKQSGQANLEKRDAVKREICNILLSRRCKFENNGIIKTCSRGFLEVLKQCDIAQIKNSRSARGRTPLMAAAKHGHASVCRWLLQNGVEVDVTMPRNGFSALHWAAYFGNALVAFWLCSYGADVNARIVQQHLTPLMLAANLGHDAVCSVLLLFRSDPLLEDDDGATAVEHASSVIASLEMRLLAVPIHRLKHHILSKLSDAHEFFLNHF